MLMFPLKLVAASYMLIQSTPTLDSQKASVWTPQLMGAVAGGIVAGIVTAMGWVVAKYKEDAARRQEASLRHLQRQIEELYGPLYGLLRQSRIIYEVAKKVLPKRQDGRLAIERFEPKQEELWLHFVDKYLRPLNSQMSEIIRTKMYLLEGGVIPDSFASYLEHAAQSEAVHSLRTPESGKLVEMWVPFPASFNDDVERTLNKLILCYSVVIKDASFDKYGLLIHSMARATRKRRWFKRTPRADASQQVGAD